MINTELAEIIPQLCNNWQPPLTIEQFQAFESALECSLPEEVKQLYLEHDGHTPRGANHLMFLMPASDALEVYADIKRREDWWWIFPNITDNIRYLWHDEDGNFMGVYVSGHLIGKMVFNNHEEPNPAPVFRSILGFYRAALKTQQAGIWGWQDMFNDYPVIDDITSANAINDLDLALICIENWKNTRDLDEKIGWGSCITALIPPNETSQLIPYINSIGFDRSKIIDIIAKRHFEPAITELTSWLLKDLRFKQSDVFSDLASITGEKAADLIQNTLPEITKVAKSSVIMTFIKLGYKIRKIDDDYEYLPPNETTWQTLS